MRRRSVEVLLVIGVAPVRDVDHLAAPPIGGAANDPRAATVHPPDGFGSEMDQLHEPGAGAVPGWRKDPAGDRPRERSWERGKEHAVAVGPQRQLQS